MEDLLNYAVPVLVAGFVVLTAGAYVLDKLPEPPVEAAAPDGLASPPAETVVPTAGPAGVAQNGTAPAGG